ncbi:spt21p [Saccharomyces arboricola H-6]|uniref:Spt21p n=1 Tax=Saccharomyces arboricola (strain H-6 / AS 2.3317 / CBS 10644) TaxID=1160507 RepID=J8PPZ3_SACAR|nr:spt21p [Saccharomyces arboricola H-6]
MAEVSKMTLKILYTLDNGSNGSYLARSRTPTHVRVANISNPFPAALNGNTELRIGAIHLETVLHEIYLNSPEVLDHDTLKDGYDYNLYYRDICEVDEPLVSLGLLSKLRKKFHKIHNSAYQPTGNNGNEQENGENDEIEVEEEDESFIVTGRVCSNFSALLRRSYSNVSSKNGRTANNQVPEETLEVKLRFSKVVTSTRIFTNSAVNPGISNIQIQSPSQSLSALPCTSRTQSLSKANQIKNSRNTRTTVTINNASTATSGRRQTNPMPAPKAVRTQSLPIWNLKPNSTNTGFPRNSIAHKIYLADRKTEVHQQNTQHQSMAYEINTLQNDNTIQKTKIDDSVSKRFDFMLNKKKPTKKASFTAATIARRQPSVNINPKHSTKINSEKKPTDKLTIARVKNPDSKSSNRSVTADQRRSSLVEPLSDNVDSVLNDILSEPVGQEQELQQKQKQHKISTINENDKENIPPQNITDRENKLYDELYFNTDLPMSDFSDVMFKDEMGWLSNFYFFESPTSITGPHPNQQNLKPSTTPKDPNTCNTVTLENEDVGEVDIAQSNKIPLTSDVDKTSPIDSLSIPLIELNHSSSGTNIQQISIKEGPALNTADSSNDTPCDNDTKDRKTSIIDSDNSKTQPMHMNFSTPADHPTSDNNGSATKKLVSLPEVQQSKRSHEALEEEEEEEEEDLKKQKAIPSSPCGMFNYHQPVGNNLSADMLNEEQEQSVDNDNVSDKTNDLFSTFVNPGRAGSRVVTSPIGEYQSLKH